VKTQPHVRLTAEELKEDYKLGLMPAHTYLLYLIRSLRRDGHKLVIDCVEEFCKEWEIPSRSFYRAKNLLIQKGKLKEQIKGRVDLWVPGSRDEDEDPSPATSGGASATSGGASATSGGASATSGGTSATSGGATPPKAMPEADPGLPSTLSQLYSDLSHLPTPHPTEETGEEEKPTGLDRSPKDPNSIPPTGSDQAQDHKSTRRGFAPEQSKYRQTFQRVGGDPWFGEIYAPWMVKGAEGRPTPHDDFTQWLQRDLKWHRANARSFLADAAQFDPIKQQKAIIYWEEYQASLKPAQPTGSRYVFVDLPNGSRVGVQVDQPNEPVQVQSQGQIYDVMLLDDGNTSVFLNGEVS